MHAPRRSNHQKRIQGRNVIRSSKQRYRNSIRKLEAEIAGAQHKLNATRDDAVLGEYQVTYNDDDDSTPDDME